jgi:prepilin-type N-terminal cleavage/methylation domain-containing protein/prepilin-type processing-associated H-X9-DG protein
MPVAYENWMIRMNDTCGRSGRSGFTLVESLVVISLLALLISLLLPALARARDVATQISCLSNIRQLGIAGQVYISDYGMHPPIYFKVGTVTTRWMDSLKSYIPKSSAVYQCPSDPLKIASTWDPDIVLSFGVNTYNFAGNAHCFWYGVPADRVVRPAKTIFMADSTPGTYYVGSGNVFVEPVPKVDYRHPNASFSALYCDGHADNRIATTRSDWDASE